MPNHKPGLPGSRLIRAAGAVAWRVGPAGELEVLLVHRKKYDDWSLPKGKIEPGETLPVTAVREVLEEGGARLALGRRLVSVRYNVGGRPKRVHYWAARVVSVDERAVPNAEIDEVAWVPAARAVEQVSYVHDHGVLADFAARPAPTVPLILLRHSKAVAKGGWKRPDAMRPLDDSGRADAKALAELLGCFAARPRLISSTAVRCADTLRPLAQLIGETVRLEPSLYLHGQSSPAAPDEPAADVTALIREVLAAGEPTIICAHRESLPALQEAALAALAGHPGAEIPVGAVPGGAVAQLPDEWDDALPTSGLWVLNVAPLPAAQERAAPDPPVTDPAAPESPDRAASVAAPARRWWHRARVPISDASGGGEASGVDVPGGDVGSGDAGPDSAGHPAGVLVSADRYDLAEP